MTNFTFAISHFTLISHFTFFILDSAALLLLSLKNVKCKMKIGGMYG